MLVCTCFTPSHRPLVDLLRKSLPPDRHQLVAEEIAQRSLTGSYNEVKGFCQSTRDKISFIQEVLSREKDPFLFVDADVVFLGDFEQDLRARLEGFDLVAQREGEAGDANSSICMGLLCLRPGRVIRELFEYIRRAMDNFPHHHDQHIMDAIVMAMRGNPNPPFRYALVDKDQGYGNWGHYGPSRPELLWRPGLRLPSRHGLKLWHANFTVGVPNKLAMNNRMLEGGL